MKHRQAFLRSVLWIGLIGFVFQATPFAADLTWNQATLGESKKKKEHTEDVVWKTTTLEVNNDAQVEIVGEFKKEEWNLMYENNPLDIDRKTGKFSLTVKLTGPTTRLEFFAISPFGEANKEVITISFPKFEEFQKMVKDATPTTSSWLVGAGFTSIGYKQTRLADFSEYALTLRGVFQAPIKGNWDYAFSGYFTPLAFGSNRDGVSVRFLGLNGRVGYALPAVKEPWRFLIMGGFYYATMFVSGTTFGYSNVAGPQLYPMVRRRINSTWAVSGYFKYSPVTDSFSVLALTNRELALGSTLVYSRPDKKPLMFMIDYSDFFLVAEGIEVANKTLSFTVGHGF